MGGGEWILVGVVIFMMALAGFMATRTGKPAASVPVATATVSDTLLIQTRAAYMSTFLPTLTVPAGPTPAGGISADDAYVLLKEGAYFLDVRTAADFAAYRIAGSVSIPLSDLKARIGDVSKTKDIVIVCFSREDCLQAQDILQTAGFTKVRPMVDGIESWVIKGYPFEGNFPY